jgi:hypothetical protein
MTIKPTQNQEPLIFSRWPNVQTLNPSNYSGLIFYVKTILQPNEEYIPAVENLVVNLFSGSEGCFCKPGNYTGKEREQVKSQLIKFSKDIRVLECLVDGSYDYSTKTKGMIGNFPRKQIYSSPDIWKLSNLFSTNSDEFDLVLVDADYPLFFDENSADETTKTIARERVESEIVRSRDNLASLVGDSPRMIECQKKALKLFEKFVEQYGGEDIQRIAYEEGVSEYLTPNLDFTCLKETNEQCNRFLLDKPNANPQVKELIEIVRSFSEEAIHIEEDLEKSIRSGTSKEDIEIVLASGFQKSLSPNGILVLNSHIQPILPIRGFKQITSYGDINVYQKEVGKK